VARVVLDRLLHTLLSLFAVTLLTFALVRLTGDPVLAILPMDASQQDYTRLRAQLGLDQPVALQYVSYLRQLIVGNLGYSYTTREPVTGIIAERFPVTLYLGVAALLIVFGVGVPVGLYSAYWQGGWLDRIGRFTAVVGQSVPQFWLGLILILVFAVRLGWLPAGGYGGLDYLALPAMTMAWTATAGITRLMRSSTLEVLNSDYIRFSRVKGVPERAVLWKHALRNAALPVLTLGGVVTGDLITGSIVTETVFAWPGLGQLIINSIHSRDFPVIQGLVLLFCAIFIVTNLIVDLVYVAMNPRLRTK
jgi:peptide/nickel transport system permease protein